MKYAFRFIVICALFIIGGFVGGISEKSWYPFSNEVFAESSQQPTKTVVGDLLDVDRDFYIVRGEHGEIQIEATYQTDITEEFEYGDRIKALMLMNNKALRIERAGPDDVSGVTIHQTALPSEPEGQEAETPPAKSAKAPTTKKTEAVSAPAESSQPDTRIVEGSILMVDGDFYVLRGERGEVRVERTPKTKVTEEFQFSDRIKATLLKNDKALVIERAK
jgi:exosome complex RNA-binding protein Csl4